MSTPPRAWTRDGPDWPNRDHSQFLRSGTTAWHVQRAGRGETLLLLHGTGGATHSWRDLFPRLSTEFDVIAPDLPGHGFSSGGISSLPGMSAAINDLLSSLDARPSVIVGHSAGAAIAVHLALAGTQHPRVLIGLNAALTPFRGVAGAVFPGIAKALALNPVTPALFSSLAGWEFQARRMLASTGSKIDAQGIRLYARLFGRASHVSGALAMMAHWDVGDLGESLSNLPCPFHLLTGTKDGAIPPEEAARLATQHPGVHLHPIDGLGHLMHEERSGDIAERVIELTKTG